MIFLFCFSTGFLLFTTENNTVLNTDRSEFWDDPNEFRRKFYIARKPHFSAIRTVFISTFSPIFTATSTISNRQVFPWKSKPFSSACIFLRLPKRHTENHETIHRPWRHFFPARAKNITAEIHHFIFTCEIIIGMFGSGTKKSIL